MTPQTRVYLSSPNNQMQADAVSGMPVLISYAVRDPWLDQYVPSFGPLLVDSGAFSAFNSGKVVDVEAYGAWAEGYRGMADAVAALDDIAGNWRQGLKNWDRFPWQFPTYHSSDPPEALEEILARRPRWVGLGMVPPRNRVDWLDRTLERLADEPCHVHGWALGAFADRPRLDSVDSTNWFMDSWKLRKTLPWLTPAECLRLVVLRYQRAHRMKRERVTTGELGGLFG
jgi:hypothetical protein